VNGPRIAIFGAGRTGGALFHGLAAAGEPPVLLWTRSEATARAAQAEGFPAVSGPLPPADVDLIFLAVTDGAVASLAAELAGRLSPRTLVAHTAGALDLSPLAPLSAAGHAVGSLHPAVSIASRRTPLAGRAAALAASTPEADAVLARVAGVLGMPIIRPQGDRARYHAACAMVGNFPQVLLEAAERLGLGAGLSREEGRLAFGSLLVGAAGNAADRGPAGGLTGPLRRGEVEIVRRHLEAIRAADPNGELLALYRAAAWVALDLAEAEGAPNIAAMKQLLG